ncbi:serine/arginine repetitive matrix protein 2-like isoform X2 [Aedes aegypti]|uniref:Uncharacterized protein n=1 Tax=Aedes aegypti TaxID=7159 RepID=A0A6I8U3E8_AEDAE|nr:serine/arginine repetitive matrix protein 2-like isoform X2 [Aedes aegypti]
MTKQTVLSPEAGTSACSKSEPLASGFELLIQEIKTHLAETTTEDTVLIGNCPRDVTEEEINKFFCGFASIVKLQQVTHRLLTTNVFVAKFDSAESASRSKVLNTLTLNGKKILLLQPDRTHFVDKRNVVELNGLQEHTEEVIYDHMTTFGNVSFVLKTTTVTYVVFEEPSAVESSCRCDYLDKYPVTIRSVLDGSTGASIETCILEQIDQNSSLLVDEEEGQINNFMQLLDMENLDDYLEADEKDKSTNSDKPLLEVGNEEIIVTEEEIVPDGEAGADVAAIEEQALQSQGKATPGTVLVDHRTKSILQLSCNLLRLVDLPQLRVAVRKVSKREHVPRKSGPKKPSSSDATVKEKKKKEKSPERKQTLSESEKKAGDPVTSKTKKKEKKDEGRVEEKKNENRDEERSEEKKDEERGQEKKKEKSPERKKTLSEIEKKAGDPVTSKTKKKEKDKGHEEMKKKEKKDKERGEEKRKEDKPHIKDEVFTSGDIEMKQEKPVEKSTKKKHEKVVVPATGVGSKNKVVSMPAAVSEEQEIAREKLKKETESNVKHQKQRKEVKVNEETGPTKSETTQDASEVKRPVKNEASVHQQFGKKAFVQLTKLSPEQIESLSTIRRESVTSQIKAEDAPGKKQVKSEDVVPGKKRKPGPDKAAMKRHLDSMKVEATEVTTKKPIKRVLSDSEDESSSKPSDPNCNTPKASHKTAGPGSSQKKKKPKLEKSVEKESSVALDTEQTQQEESSTKDEKQSEVANEQLVDVSTASSEVFGKISESVPDIANTVEICQVESAADIESEDEQPLVIDEPEEEVIEIQSMEQKKPDRIVVALDAKSAGLLKGKTHDENLLFLDVLPKLLVKLKRITSTEHIVSRPKDHATKSSDHHVKPPAPKKVSFDASSVKKKEEKSDKPRKTNLDRIDSKFLPANSKLKSKVKSKTDINHKKHLPVPDLPIELKTHLNTSFKIPKKNSSVTSIDRNASELNCLHKEANDPDIQRKRFQKERKPRDNTTKNRDWKQKRSETSGPPKEREPSPDYFDPALDDHSPSPQRIPPTPPQADPPTSASGPPKPTPRNENWKFEPPNRGANKPTFQEIWNIPKEKPEVWAQPPWQANNAPSNTIGSGDTWDAEPAQRPLREQNLNSRQNVPPDSRDNWSPGGPKARGPHQRNTIDAGESWSPGGAAQRKPQQTIDHGESWSPGRSKSNPRQEMPRRRSISPRQVQLSNTISTGDMWDDAGPGPASRSQDRARNPLLSDETWDDDQEPTGASPERRRQNQVADRQRSLDRRRRSADRSPIRPDRRNFRRSRSRDRSPIHRQRSRSPALQGRRSLDRWNPGVNRSPDRRNLARDRSPYVDMRQRGRSRSPPIHRRGSPFRGSPSRVPSRSRRSCSPPRPDLSLGASDMWDADRPLQRMQRLSPRQDTPRNTLLSGDNWDDDVPLRDRERQPRDQRFPLERISPDFEGSRSRERDRERDRSLSGRRDTSFDRPLMFERSDNRWSRDRSPDRRKRSRSRSPERWPMERPSVRRRRSFGEHSPSYQNTLDYWKAVEDEEMGNISPERHESPERWSPRDILEPGDRSWSPPPPRVEKAHKSRIDSEEIWANEPKPKYSREVSGSYSPSSALDAISSEDEDDFGNTKRGKKQPFDTIPLKLLSRTQSPPIRLGDLSVAAVSTLDRDRDASRDSFDSIPSYKDLDSTTLGSMDNKESSSKASSKADIVPENLLPQPHVAPDEKKTVLDNLKQRAERLKKLEEMKQARQKLLAQIKQKSVANVLPSAEPEPKPSEAPESVKPVDQGLEDETKESKSEPLVVSQTAVSPRALLATVNALLSSVDKSLIKPSVPEPGSLPIPLSQIVPVPVPVCPVPLPVCPPLPPIAAPPIPPLPADAPPPPPPDNPPPPPTEPIAKSAIPFPANAWVPSPFAPMLPVDVSQPPPPLVNPLLQPMEPQRQLEDDQPSHDFPNFHRETRTSDSPLHPSGFLGRFQGPELNRRPNLPVAPNLPSLVPPEENMFIRKGIHDFNERPFQHGANRNMRPEPNRGQNFNDHPGRNQSNIAPPEENRFGRGGDQDFNPNRRPNFNAQQGNNQFNAFPPEDNEMVQRHNFNGNNFPQGGNRDPRQQGRPNFQQQQRFGGNQQFDQNQQQRDPRQSHAGNIYGGGRGRGGRFNRNQGNNFNNNQGNRFNNFNNNNPGNNFINQGNRFNNNRRNNFNDNFGGNPGNFDNCDSGNDFEDNSGNNFNNNSDNNFNNNFNDNSDCNFNDNSDNNFDSNFNDDSADNSFNNNPGNNFNNNSGNRFNNNNNQQQRFNFQQRNQRFNNNNRFNNQQQQQQPRFMQQMMMQQQQMFDEGCFDMNEMDGGDNGGGGDENWDDME